MDKEVVVREFLSEPMIEAGKRLIERLDESDSDVQAAFWIFFPDEKCWKLIIASESVEHDGPRQFYKRVLEANKKADESESVVSLHDVGATDTSDTFVKLFRTAISTGDEIAGIRFLGNAINGTFIEDSYIYRINLKT